MNPIDPNRPVRPTDQTPPSEQKPKTEGAAPAFRLDRIGQTGAEQPTDSAESQHGLLHVRRVLDSLADPSVDQSAIVESLVRDQLTQQFGSAVDPSVVQQVTDSIMDDPQMTQSLQTIINAAKNLPDTPGEARSSS